MIKKVKLKLTILILLSIVCSKLGAQQAVTASGGNASGSTGTVSYSIGQIAYTSTSGISGSVNEGVQQPYEFFTVGNIDNKDITLFLDVYPNPTSSLLKVKVDRQNFNNLSFQLYSISGNLILSQKINSAETSVIMDNLPNATYILKITENNTTIKSFQIFKSK